MDAGGGGGGGNMAMVEKRQEEEEELGLPCWVPKPHPSPVLPLINFAKSEGIESRMEEHCLFL